MGAIKAARTKNIGTRVEKKFGASLYKGVVTDVFGELETKQGLQRAYFYHIKYATSSLLIMFGRMMIAIALHTRERRCKFFNPIVVRGQSPTGTKTATKKTCFGVS